MKTKIERQTQLLDLFIKRTPMYIGEVNRTSIIDFMVGFECGSDCDQLWTNKLSNHLEETYKIKKVSLGWPYQIEQLSKINGESWEESFVKIMTEILKTQTL
jgi:hypothetical protein